MKKKKDDYDNLDPKEKERIVELYRGHKIRDDYGKRVGQRSKAKVMSDALKVITQKVC